MIRSRYVYARYGVVCISTAKAAFWRQQGVWISPSRNYMVHLTGGQNLESQRENAAIFPPVKVQKQTAESCSTNVMPHGRSGGTAVLSPTSYQLKDISGMQQHQ